MSTAFTEQEQRIFIGSSDEKIWLNLKYANRHGLITGATGTGKTITLQTLAESFSDAGVPVFAADVKGDLCGLAAPAKGHPKITERLEEIGQTDYTPQRSPTLLWDLFQEKGTPVRVSLSEMGPILLAALLELNETQTGILHVCFAYADDQGLLLLDLKDLRSLLAHVNENRAQISQDYGQVSTVSIGAIQRKILAFEQEGGKSFFGEPALRLEDLMQTTPEGKGYISILEAEKLMRYPRTYAMFLLWLMSELFEELPEVGDMEKPRLVFFFDEAHLLFKNAPKALLGKIEQVVRLIRSKGVGLYFITQNPTDIPDDVLSQLGNRIQHALRAYTPNEIKAVKAAANSFRPNPDFKTEEVISQLGVGEALVSTLQKKGIPSVVQRTLIRPPYSQIGPLSAPELAQEIQNSPLLSMYGTTKDRYSAYEALQQRAQEKAEEEEARTRETQREDRWASDETDYLPQSYKRKARSTGRTSSRSRKTSSRRRSSSKRQTSTEAMAKSFLRSAGSQIGRSLVRGVLGSLMRKR